MRSSCSKKSIKNVRKRLYKQVMDMVEKLVEHIVKQLVSQPASVMVTSIEADGRCAISIHVAAQDVARVIGSEGRIFRAMRTVASIAGSLKNKEVSVELAQ